MEKTRFFKESFFDLTGCCFPEIFDGAEFVWEVLPKIAIYIKLQFQKGILIANYKDKRDIFIGKGTIIQEGAVILGPAIIGKNCVIGHGSLVRENCLLGDFVHIGHAVEVKNSIFLNRAKASHLSYIGDSLIGNDVNISGGAMLANFRFDKKPVTVRVNNERINTNLQKFGAIIGDGSNIGVNAVLNPGTILGKKTIVYPLTSVGGVHKDEEVIK